ncbi:MAG: hypothetical protein HOG03_22940 [Desulfobacula sp.]|uniref:hypothetical protein n=1 Tax=Desulfobacula sp. TaxID=2593537 RepID=UPI001E0516FD|nr:hypothetical protein [Desulfobacula sp.]MBT3487800.1 hypothetical protein [Desulfobacula sp.]MBT3807420.1 hypothetical protein [Desulfobacula sp.]MBT4027555.1 hypothetical protein [Desulfobacula sp.]MBT4199538.1 hypothetical protein [Desulfobacula sp.]
MITNFFKVVMVFPDFKVVGQILMGPFHGYFGIFKGIMDLSQHFSMETQGVADTKQSCHKYIPFE